MKTVFSFNRDFLAGSLIAVVGVLCIIEAVSYRLGTAAQMGPGFFPLGLGILMVALGFAIILVEATGASSENAEEEPPVSESISWRPLIALPLSIIIFATVVTRFGLGPAIFLAVFTSTFADRSLSLTRSLIIAVTMSIICILIFRVGLGIQTRAFIW